MFGSLRFIMIFDNFLLTNQGDLSAHCLYHFSTSNVLRLRCNNTLIFLWRFQCYNFKPVNFMRNPLFKIAFLNDRNTLSNKSFTLLVVTFLDYHFVQSDLLGSRFLKGLNCVRFLFKFAT